MASAVREISSSALAHASPDLRVRPPNATATPAINCRLVGVFMNALEFFLSFILVLHLSSRDRNASDHPSKICSRYSFPGKGSPSQAYFSTHDQGASMPYPVGHRSTVKKNIIDSARKLFNRHGFESVSIHQIMAGAGLTHGGF